MPSRKRKQREKKKEEKKMEGTKDGCLARLGGVMVRSQEAHQQKDLGLLGSRPVPIHLCTPS